MLNSNNLGPVLEIIAGFSSINIRNWYPDNISITTRVNERTLFRNGNATYVQNVDSLIGIGNLQIGVHDTWSY